jgi:hypothetical protein
MMKGDEKDRFEPYNLLPEDHVLRKMAKYILDNPGVAQNKVAVHFGSKNAKYKGIGNFISPLINLTFQEEPLEIDGKKYVLAEADNAGLSMVQVG